MPKHSKYKGLSAQPGNYSQDIKDFGANVRKYREMRGLSLDALADLIDSDKGAVSKLENGDRIKALCSISLNYHVLLIP